MPHCIIQASMEGMKQTIANLTAENSSLNQRLAEEKVCVRCESMYVLIDRMKILSIGDITACVPHLRCTHEII